MTVQEAALEQFTRWLGRGAALLGFAAGVVALMLWLAGWFSPKTPTTNAANQALTPTIDGQLVKVRLIRLPLSESAVGTIRAVHETTIGSKLLARVVEVNLKAGQKVKAGDMLVRLDDTDLRAKLQQAKAAVTSLEAAHAQAARDAERGAQLIDPQGHQRRNTKSSARTCDPPRRNCCGRGRPSRKCRRRWIGPPSAPPSTAP